MDRVLTICKEKDTSFTDNKHCNSTGQCIVSPSWCPHHKSCVQWHLCKPLCSRGVWTCHQSSAQRIMQSGLNTSLFPSYMVTAFLNHWRNKGWQHLLLTKAPPEHSSDCTETPVFISSLRSLRLCDKFVKASRGFMFRDHNSFHNWLLQENLWLYGSCAQIFPKFWASLLPPSSTCLQPQLAATLPFYHIVSSSGLHLPYRSNLLLPQTSSC